MRYVFAAIVICSIGAPATSALPTPNPDHLSVSKANVAQVAKKSRPAPQRQSRGSGGAGGIHPLVGSGEY
jgi:hypothetical protein